MKKFRAFSGRHLRLSLWLLLAGVLLACLLIFRLGSLTKGVNQSEVQAATMPVGWHGIYQSPLYLPLKILRSVVFALFRHHGVSLTRLPNAIFGGLTIAAFSALIYMWHGRRTAILTSLLFATSAWTLHVSRLASFDVTYLWAVPSLLLISAVLAKFVKKNIIWYGSLLTLGLILYIPGLIWLVLIELYFTRRSLLTGWSYLRTWWQRGLTVIIPLLTLVPLALNFSRAGQLRQWLGLPSELGSFSLLAKHFAGVPFHLFVSGPRSADGWLGRMPILDVFTLVMCLLGFYFYATRFKAGRSRQIFSFLAVGWVMVGVDGPVSLSLLVPILYAVAATGITYLLHDWLQVFPLNPLARGLGVALVSVVVCLAAIYNLRAYFVAWPHNPATKATFHYKL